MNKKVTEEHLNKTLELARGLQKGVSTAKDNIFVERIGPIVNAPKSKIFLIRLMDVAFRSSDYKKVSKYISKLLKKPENYKGLFKWYEKILINIYKSIGSKVPAVSIPTLLSQIKSVTNSIVFYVGDVKFADWYKKRKDEGVQLNVNLIGEMLVGNDEGDERIEDYKHLINQDNVDYISIKISTIYSHINAFAYGSTVENLVKRLSLLYDEVLNVKKKTGVAKFINLDM